jgi:23S rRNA pseudouridine2605 synthase
MVEERLQKLIAKAGIASRRKAEELIKSGAVTVNGKLVTQLGAKADPEKDHIKVQGKLINPSLARRQKVYFLLNKPRGVLSSTDDPKKRKLVVDFVPEKYGRVFPVGRLDYNSEGLIILTNDGELANLIASSKTIPKVYNVKVKGIPSEKAIERLRRGIRLKDGYKTAPAQIKQIKVTEKNAWFEVILYEGHNRQIRKMFDEIRHSVIKLRRVQIGHLTDKGLPVGRIRELSKEEVQKFFSAEKKYPG